MALHLKHRLNTGVTVIANSFIDTYMADANGEYIKVYLYLLRHESQELSVEMIADALNHTEADVRRALAYWQKAGVLSSDDLTEEISRTGEASERSKEKVKMPDLDAGQASLKKAVEPERKEKQTAEKEIRPSCSREAMNRLSQDGEFSQLLYIAQKYLNKTFTPRECEVFAYLYDTLKMPPELLEYLVEYSAQNGHTSIRYIEAVALNWHERKLLTVEEAKAYSSTFSKDCFAVMKAFGLTGRSPADAEYTMMERWFRTYGFTKELIVEACNRTMRQIHTPSFQYTDKILTEWNDAGVHTLRDVAELDKLREEKRRKEKNNGNQTDSRKKQQAGKTTNRFHNLEQHGYDYDEMVWNMMNKEE